MREQASTFAERLRQYRLRAGLSQAALAERAGLATDAVAALEQGVRRSPYAHTLGALAEALRLSVDERALLVAAARTRRSASLGGEPDPRRDLPPRVPAPRTQLIGRERDIRRVTALLGGSPGQQSSPRLVTLTGVGGVGKTSLALSIGAKLRTAFHDDVWLVELAPLADAALLSAAVGAALGLPDVAEPSDAVVTFLRTRHALLILDNCEHVVDACAQLASRLLDTCPEVRLLATSREPLLVRGEHQVRVQPLPPPEGTDALAPERLASNPAVQLFMAYAQAASVDLCLTPDVAPAVARICIRLEGIPLALELAAARLTVLTPQQVLDRLDNAFELLGRRSRAAPTRQQTLRATLDWSYELLTAREQAVFRRLGIFAGGCVLEAAEAICPLDDFAPADVLDLLARLADKSLLIADPGAGTARYRLLDPVRQYATQRVASSGENDAVEQRHTTYYLALAEQATPELSGPHQADWLTRLDRELDNLRAAVQRMAQQPDATLEMRLVTALRPYWEVRGQLREGRRGLEHAVGRARSANVPERLLRDALFGAGRLSQWQGDLDYSGALIEESLALSRDLGDQNAVAEALAWLGTVYRRQGSYEKAMAALQEGLALGRALGVSVGYASSLTCLGVLVGQQGNPVQGCELLEEGLALFLALGDLRWQAITLVMLAEMNVGQGQLVRARGCLVDGLRLLQAIGDPVFVLFAVEGLAYVQVRTGEWARAARWLGATERLRERVGARRALPNWQDRDRILAGIREHLSEAELTAALSAGHDFGLEEILAEALASAARAPAPAPVLASNTTATDRNLAGRLTRREREVAELLRLGCSDREIAARLSISVGTASLHVHRVLTKLDLRSRWQVSDWLDRVATRTSASIPCDRGGGRPRATYRAAR